jgi:hypothetical protein
VKNSTHFWERDGFNTNLKINRIKLMLFSYHLLGVDQCIRNLKYLMFQVLNWE